MPDLEHPLLRMFETLPLGAVLVSGDGLRVNGAVERITGYHRSELTTREEWFRKLYREMYDMAMRQYLEDREAGLNKVAHAPFYTKAGELRIAEYVATMLEDDEIWLVRDLTDAQRTAERLEYSLKELQEREAQIKALNERLELAIRAGGVGIWETDLATHSFLFNAQMYEIYGIGDAGFRSDVPPDTFAPGYEAWLKVLHPDDIEVVDQAFARAMAEPGVVEYEYRIFRPSGEMRYVRSAAQVIRDQNGVPYRGVGTTMDITAERESAAALRGAKEAAEAAERAKSDFLAAMSHEIRTPMNTVLGMTRLALQTDLTPKQANYLSKIDQSARALVAIINDILDFSKIEAGKLELEQTEFTLESILESVANVTVMKAEEKGIEIVFCIESGVPERIVGDPLRLGQILINLVNNAVKFTDQGEIVITISPVHATLTGMGRADTNMTSILFTVRDSGIGLEQSQVGTLFNAFTQADAKVARQYGGTGLGLAICRQLVEMMGGRIWASGEPGIGSTFSFTLRTKLPDEARILPDFDEIPGLSGRRVLIVDDNASARDILASMVNRFGMIVDVAASGPTALEILREASRLNHPFELVLMDWRMPEMDGLEAARLIKSDPALQYTPAVLMVTAYGREEIVRHAEELRLEGVLTKPVTDSVLFNTIAEALGCVHVGRRDVNGVPETERDRASQSRMPPPEMLAQIAGRRVLVVDDNALNREVVSDFLLAVNLRVDTAIHGIHALEQLSSYRYDVVLMDVHMPEMDGLTAAREIRRHPQWTHIPIVALTAQAQTSDREQSLAAGMNIHLTKPIDEAELYATLVELLVSPETRQPEVTKESSVAARQAEGQQEKGPQRFELPDSLPYMDIPAALARLSGNPDRVLRLMRGFLRDFTSTPDQIVADLEASRYNEVALAAHTIKSSAAYLGAEQLSQAAAQVERTARIRDADALNERMPIFLDQLEAVLRTLNTTLHAPSPNQS